MSKFKQKMKAHTGQQKQSLIKAVPDIPVSHLDGLISFNFKQMDVDQGERFSVWHEEGLLVDALTTMRDYCSHSIDSAKNNLKLKIYDTFPKESKFKFPKHISKDAVWCAFRVQKAPRIVGHYHNNVFYVVFLDKDHRFYPMDIKNNSN